MWYSRSVLVAPMSAISPQKSWADRDRKSLESLKDENWEEGEHMREWAVQASAADLSRFTRERGSCDPSRNKTNEQEVMFILMVSNSFIATLTNPRGNYVHTLFAILCRCMSRNNSESKKGGCWLLRSKACKWGLIRCRCQRRPMTVHPDKQVHSLSDPFLQRNKLEKTNDGEPRQSST